MKNPKSAITAALIPAVLGIAVARAQVAGEAGPVPADSRPAASRSLYRPQRVSHRAGLYYGNVWGVDSLSVRYAESGEIIRFSYHVLDTDKAAPLNDKRSEPLLIDPRAGVKLVVPSLEKVGQLRQSSPPVAGKSYWMAFSNKGRRVRRGDYVSVVIGNFHAEGLVVE